MAISQRRSKGDSTTRAPKPSLGRPKLGTDRVSEKRLVILQRVAVVGVLLLVAVLVLAVPMKGYLTERAGITAAQAELTELKNQNDDMAARSRLLNSPEEIQRIARSDYGLVVEGEESYTVLPSVTAGLVLPRTWPFDRLSGPLAHVSTGKP